MHRIVKIILPYLLVLILSYPTVKPLLSSGYFPMHDDTQPSRVFEMAQSLKDGQFPVRLVKDLGYGYGYPLFNFYAPLPYYIGAFIHLFGIDVVSATKVMMLVGMLLAAISMYALVHEVSGTIAGLVSAILYLYAPYHAVQLYVRGAIGELYAYGFLPLLLLGFFLILKSGKKNNTATGIVLGSIGLAGVLLSHNIMGMITVLFSCIWIIIIMLIRRKKLAQTSLLLFLGIGISAFFIFPALFESRYTSVTDLTVGGSDFRNHFVTLSQLWDSPWGFAGSAPGLTDGMSFKIGKIHIILGLIGVFASWFLYKKKTLTQLQLSIVNCQLLIVISSIFLMLSESQILWQIIPGFAYVQYPWRLLVFTVLSLSILAANSIPLLNTMRKQVVVAFVVIGFVLLVNAKLFTPQFIKSINDQDYTSNEALRYRISKISDEYLPRDLIRPESVQDTAESGLTQNNFLIIRSKEESATKKVYRIQNTREQTIFTNISYFPGWIAKLDNFIIPLSIFQGKITIQLPVGDHVLLLQFQNTPVRIFSNTISLLSLFLLGYVAITSRYSREGFFITKKPNKDK